MATQIKYSVSKSFADSLTALYENQNDIKRITQPQIQHHLNNINSQLENPEIADIAYRNGYITDLVYNYYNEMKQSKNLTKERFYSHAQRDINLNKEQKNMIEQKKEDFDEGRKNLRNYKIATKRQELLTAPEKPKQLPPPGIEVQNQIQDIDDRPALIQAIEPTNVIRKLIDVVSTPIQPVMDTISYLTGNQNLSSVGTMVTSTISSAVQTMNQPPPNIAAKIKPPQTETVKTIKATTVVKTPIKMNKQPTQQPMEMEPDKVQQFVPPELQLKMIQNSQSSVLSNITNMPYGKKRRFTKRFTKFRKNRFRRNRGKRSNRKRNYDYQIKLEDEVQEKVVPSGLLWTDKYNTNVVLPRFTTIHIAAQLYPEIYRFAPIFTEYSIRKVVFHYQPNIVSKTDLTSVSTTGGIVTSMAGVKTGFLIVDNRKLNREFQTTQTMQDIAKQKTCSVFSLDTPFSFTVRPCEITKLYTITSDNTTGAVEETAITKDNSSTIKKKKSPWLKFSSLSTTGIRSW